MTIKDLAAQTGYAVGTISRVLNNHPNVSEKARAAILKAVEESGFELNVNAKQLKQLHTNTILVVVKGTGNELFGEMVEYIQARMAQTRYSLAVDYQDEDSNEVRRAIQLSREKKPLGILFLGGNTANFLEDFGKIDIPCVLVTNDGSGLPFTNLSSVSTDDREASRQAADALIRLGHRRIVMVGGDRWYSDTGRLRYEGFLSGMEAAELPFDPERDYRAVRFSYQGGYAATRSLLESGAPFTAMFAAADVIAIGAIRALKDAGLRVPEDVSVIGFDGLPLSGYLVPQLATVSQSARVMALRGVDLLLEHVEQGGAAQHETVPFQVFSQRESVRPLT